jgi:hypothetical protein
MLSNIKKLIPMNIKAIIKNIIFGEGIWMQKKTKQHELKKFIQRFSDMYTCCKLDRIGKNDEDGGYLLPAALLNNIKYCFSPGTAADASFESHLSNKYNIKSFMADASVNGPPFLDKNFNFTKKFLSSRTYNFINYDTKNSQIAFGMNDEIQYITLKDWMESCLNETQLKEEREGGGYYCKWI